MPKNAARRLTRKTALLMTAPRRPASISPSTPRCCRRLLSTLLVLGIAGALTPVQDVFAARRHGKPPTAQGEFTDHLSSYDSSRWLKADGWKNGPPFDNAWLADHITFTEGLMRIRLDDQGALGEPFGSGNYQSTDFYGYGCFETSFKPVASSGVVSSFFTFAGPFDNGGNGLHNEIDIEFLGYDTRFLQANFWTNDDSYAGGNEAIIDLGFDAAQDFHRYGFRWTAGGIEWYVDGSAVYQVFDSPTNPTPKAEESLQKVMMNVWPVDSSASGWAGTFVYPGSALHGHYDWVRHIAGEDCSLAEAPTPPPPPPAGNADEIHTEAIDLSLNNRHTQVIARVAIADGLGQPVADASIDAVWSGIITGGDGHRTTDSDGIATFYSARTNKAGTVSFCVTAVTGGGRTYVPADNVETCDAIDK